MGHNLKRKGLWFRHIFWGSLINNYSAKFHAIPLEKVLILLQEPQNFNS